MISGAGAGAGAGRVPAAAAQEGGSGPRWQRTARPHAWSGWRSIPGGEHACWAGGWGRSGGAGAPASLRGPSPGPRPPLGVCAASACSSVRSPQQLQHARLSQAAKPPGLGAADTAFESPLNIHRKEHCTSSANAAFKKMQELRSVSQAVSLLLTPGCGITGLSAMGRGGLLEITATLRILYAGLLG